ncbi:MAG: transcriptional repressor [Anaerovoracaceae bacterium]
MQKRNTVQKDVILKTVTKLKIHPTAEEIYAEVVCDYPRISKATVYRNLNQMAEAGIILRIQVPNSADCYDYHVDNHYHLKCTKCGRIYDVEIPYMEELDKKFTEKSGCEIDGHSIIFKGRCSKCFEKH